MTRNREFGWVRQVKRATEIADVYQTDQEKRVIINGLESLGFEKVQAPALYDNGDFIVLDSVKDLSFMVLRILPNGSIGGVLRDVHLDKYEAIRIADEFKEALVDGG